MNIELVFDWISRHINSNAYTFACSIVVHAINESFKMINISYNDIYIYIVRLRILKIYLYNMNLFIRFNFYSLNWREIVAINKLLTWVFFSFTYTGNE